MNLKILIVGLGSIGQRHLKHLQRIGGLEIASFRTRKGELATTNNIKEFYDEDDALNFNPDGVIVSNPSALHVETAIPFLKRNIRVLIEKPVGISLESAELLKPYDDLIRVAYCMRFHSLFKFLKNRFDSEPPFKVGFKRSFYLPNWHPYADYKKEYTAVKSLGGGVIRTLNHEMDISMDFFGNPGEITGVVDKISHLKIDTDDFAFFTLKTEKNVRITFELDFFSPNHINIGEAYTIEGKYEWNMEEVQFTSYHSSQPDSIYIASDNALDVMYQDQMRDFCQFLKNGESKNATLEEGLNILKIIEDLEK